MAAETAAAPPTPEPPQPILSGPEIRAQMEAEVSPVRRRTRDALGAISTVSRRIFPQQPPVTPRLNVKPETIEDLADRLAEVGRNTVLPPDERASIIGGYLEDQTVSSPEKDIAVELARQEVGLANNGVDLKNIAGSRRTRLAQQLEMRGDKGALKQSILPPEIAKPTFSDILKIPGETLDEAGRMSRAYIRDLAAHVSGFDEASGNMRAVQNGQPEPFDQVVGKDDRGLLQDVTEGIAETLPKIALTTGLAEFGAPASLASALPFSFNAEGFQPKEAIVMGLFPAVGKIGESLALKAADKLGFNTRAPLAASVVSNLGRYAGAEAWMQLSSLPEYIKATPEERKDLWAHNAAMNLAFHLPNALGISREAVNEVRDFIEFEARTTPSEAFIANPRRGRTIQYQPPEQQATRTGALPNYAIDQITQPSGVQIQPEGILEGQNLRPNTGQIREEARAETGGGGGLRPAETQPLEATPEEIQTLAQGRRTREVQREESIAASRRKKQKPVVPETPAEPYETVIETVRNAGARTIRQIQELFPDAQLSREEARAFRNQAWGEPAREPVAEGPPIEPTEQAAPYEAIKKLRQLRESQLEKQRRQQQAEYAGAKERIKKQAGITEGPSFEQWQAEEQARTEAERQAELEASRQAGRSGPLNRGRMGQELGRPAGKTWEEYQAEELERQRAEGRTGPLGQGKGQQVFGGRTLESGQQVTTPEFQNWFAGSKVVDKQGNPLVVYHGTDQDFTTFRQAKEGSVGKGIYFTPRPEAASAYSLESAEAVKRKTGSNVIPAYLSIKNPLTVSLADNPNPATSILMKLGFTKEKANYISERALESKGNITNELQSRAIAKGYDGFVVLNKEGGIHEAVAFDPRQVKSAIGNRGTFDPNNPNILESGSRAKSQAEVFSGESYFWMAPDGGLIPAPDGHSETARRILGNVKFGESLYVEMFKRGYARISKEGGDTLHVDTSGPERISNQQRRALRDLAIETKRQVINENGSTVFVPLESGSSGQSIGELDHLLKPGETLDQLLDEAVRLKPEYKELVDSMRKAGVNPDVRSVASLVSRKTGTEIAGEYNIDNNTIYLRRFVPNQIDTLMEEMVHAATVEAFHKDPVFAGEMGRILQVLRSKVDDPGKFYYLQNELELIAGAYVDPRTKRLMQSVRAVDEPNLNLWQKFTKLIKEGIRRLFGVANPAIETALDRVLKLSGERFKPNVTLPKDIQALEAPITRNPEEARLIYQEKEQAVPGSGKAFLESQQAAEAGIGKSITDLVNATKAVAARKLTEEEVAADPTLRPQQQVAQATLNNRFVQRNFAGPVEGLEKSAELLGGKITNWQQLRNDPNADPVLRSRATGDALDALDDLERSGAEFDYEYDSKKTELTKKLTEAIDKKSWNITDKEAAEALLDDLKEVGYELAQATKDTGGIEVFQKVASNKTALRNAMQFIATHADFDLIQRGVITTSRDFLEHVKSQAEKLREPQMNSIDEVTHSSSDELAYVADLVMKSEPYRQRLSDASELFQDKATQYPLDKFMQRIKQQAWEGNFSGAIQTFAKGYGATVEELNISRKAARVAGRSEYNLLNQLQTLDAVKQFFATARGQPEMQAARNEIYRDLGAKALIKSSSGVNYTITAPVKVESGDPTKPARFTQRDFKIDMSDQSEAGVKKMLDELEQLKQATVEYTSDATDPDYSPARAAAMRMVVADLDLMANPTINPRVGKIMATNNPARWLPRKFFSLLGRPETFWQNTSKYGAGFAAMEADRKANAYATVKEKLQAVFNLFDRELTRAETASMKSHGMKRDDQLRQWERKVWNPLAGSHQYFESTFALKAGDAIGNGETVTHEDMKYLKLWRKFDKSFRSKLTGAEAAESIRRAGAGVVETGARGERRIRKETETGPNTVARRILSALPLSTEWSNSDYKKRIDILDANFDQLVLGYMSDVAYNVPFRHAYRFGNEIKFAFLEGKQSNNPIRTFAELAHRIADEYNIRHSEEGGEMIDANQVADVLLREFDGLFKKLANEKRVFDEKPSTDLTVSGGGNSFNSARGEQIFPSTWYDYGSVTSTQHAAHLAGGSTPFLFDYINAVRGLDNVLKAIVTRFKNNEPLRRESKKQRLAGTNFYDWKGAQEASREVTTFLTKLEAATRFSEEKQPIQGESPAMLSAGQEYIIGSLVGGQKALTYNLLGGAWKIIKADRFLQSRNIISSAIRNGAMLTKEGIKLAIHEGNPVGYALKKAAQATDFLPWVNGLSKKILGILEANRQLYGQSAEEGLTYTDGLGKTTKAMWDNRLTGGRNIEAPVDQSLFDKAWQVAGVTPTRIAGRWTSQMMRMVDGFLNMQSVRMVDEFARNYEKRARDFGGLRIEQALKEGRDPYDPTDRRNMFTPDELVRNPWNPLSHGEHDAAMVRDWFIKQGEINIDARMMDYARRWKEAEDAGHPGVDESGKAIRMFTEPEMIQLRIGHAGLTNLARFDNRPVRTSKEQSRLLLLLSYKAWQMQDFVRHFDGLHNRGFFRRMGALAPQAMQVILLAAMGGALGLGATNMLSQMRGVYSAQPTVFNANNSKDMAQAVMTGMAQEIPFYGDIYNQVSGNAYKTGWDINNQFVLLNLATDLAKFNKQVWQTGDLTYPSIQFARRWTFPANWAGHFIPHVAGLQEYSNTRNILNRVAKGMGMETRMDKGGVSATQNYGPTTPLLNDFANAVGKGDSAGAKAAFDNLVGFYTKQGLDPLEAKRRALSGIRTRNPLTQVFGSAITQGQLDGLYAKMTDSERRVVTRALGNYEGIVNQLGTVTGLTKEAKATTKKAGARQKLPPGIAGRIIGRATRIGRRTRNPLQRINRRLGIRQPRKKRTRAMVV